MECIFNLESGPEMNEFLAALLGDIDGERGEGDRLDLNEMKSKLKHFSNDYK